MTPEQEARNWKRLCGGKTPPKPLPAPVFVPTPDDDPHPERRTDPRYQWQPWRRGGYLEFLRANGWLNQSRLDAHFEACARRSQSGTTGTAVKASLATGVEGSVEREPVGLMDASNHRPPLVIATAWPEVL